MSNDNYEKLRKLIDTHALGCPPASEIIDILKILFSEDEARVALGLGFRPFTVNEIADRAGVEASEAGRHLESLANKGLVFAREKNGDWGYAMLNVINLFENPYRKGLQDETIKKLTPLWKKYRTTLAPELGTETTSVARVIPIQTRIASSAEVLSYEKIEELIENAHVMGIARCACREFEQNCDAPREACMVFDATCNYLVERGFARTLTKNEMKQKLKECDDYGLVRQVNNTRDRLEFVCHCCPCCCRLLHVLTNLDNPRIVTRSAFLPVTDMEKCEGCGTCANERCPTGARFMVDDRPVLTTEKCIGCGLCSTGCPNDAICMERSIEVPEPPANYMEMGMRLLQDRGKLEEFIKINTL
jgi:formate hydrogenlyase subunit 6/NADH:ubiquinone oxidoreductase subunit I/DNA-binding transcriptional ArsR family regulator